MGSTTAFRQVALLRGVNVGRANRISMADLRAVAGRLGFGDATTLLNSGNLVYTCSRAAARTAAVSIEKELRDALGIESRVVTLDAGELDTIIAENTLLDVATSDSHLLVAVPRRAEDMKRLAALEGKDWAPEALALGSRAAYLWCDTGVIASVVSPAVNRALDNDVTSRNWATILKLRELVRGA